MPTKPEFQVSGSELEGLVRTRVGESRIQNTYIARRPEDALLVPRPSPLCAHRDAMARRCVGLDWDRRDVRMARRSKVEGRGTEAVFWTLNTEVLGEPGPRRTAQSRE